MNILSGPRKNSSQENEITETRSSLVSLIIPCYNEEESLPTLFGRLDELRESIKEKPYQLELVLVDDGSNDATWPKLQARFKKDPMVRLLRHKKNAGYGKALKSGFFCACGMEIVTVDADTNYDLREIPALLEHLGSGIDIVTGSPFLNKSNWHYPFHRMILSRGVTILYRLILGHNARNISVFTCGFRAYKREILASVLPIADDFLANAEILVRSLLLQHTVVQFPTTVHMRLHGRSKISIIRTIKSHLQLLWKLWRDGVLPDVAP